MPNRIRYAAMRNMEALLRLYYLRHGFDHFDAFLSPYLVQLGFITLHKLRVVTATASSSSTTTTTITTTTNTEGMIRTLRSTLLLVAVGLHAQGQTHFLGKAILRALTSRMEATERQLLAQLVGDHPEPEPVEARLRSGHVRSGHVRSDLLPSALSFADDPEAHRLGRLVREGVAVEHDEVAEKDGEGAEEGGEGVE
jgi:hypothetical protein